MSMILSIINDSLKEINSLAQTRINQLKKEGACAFSEGDLELVQCFLKEGRLQKQALNRAAEIQDEWAQLIEIHTFVINHKPSIKLFRFVSIGFKQEHKQPDS